MPVTFIITSSKAHDPLARWLLCLKISVPLYRTPMLMIDCSVIEMPTITIAFRNLDICLCCWHMLRLYHMQASSKLHVSQVENRKFSRMDDIFDKNSRVRKAAFCDLIMVIYAQNVEDFGKMWCEDHLKYVGHQNWFSYLENQ